jgi:hypothetical protein
MVAAKTCQLSGCQSVNRVIEKLYTAWFVLLDFVSDNVVNQIVIQVVPNAHVRLVETLSK